MANHIPIPSIDASAIRVVQIFVSPGHDYWTKAGEEKLSHGILEVSQVECVAGHGLRGDRYCEGRANRKGQVTFIPQAAIDEIRDEFQLPQLSASVFRRNIVVSCAELSQLLNRRFEIQGIAFEGSQECTPCNWMNRVVAPGAKKFMQENFRGGIRAKIITNGTLRVSASEAK